MIFVGEGATHVTGVGFGLGMGQSSWPKISKETRLTYHDVWELDLIKKSCICYLYLLVCPQRCGLSRVESVEIFHSKFSSP